MAWRKLLILIGWYLYSQHGWPIILVGYYLGLDSTTIAGMYRKPRSKRVLYKTNVFSTVRLVYNNKRGLASSFLYKLFMNKKTISVVLLGVFVMVIGSYFLMVRNQSTTEEIFAGVEMTTLRNDYFEITYPTEWQKNEYVRMDADHDALYYSVTPDSVSQGGLAKGMINPLLSIDVEKTQRVSLNPDTSLGERTVSFSGTEALFAPGREGVDAYYILHDGRLYSIHVNKIPAYSISSEEIGWILARVKIVD